MDLLPTAEQDEICSSIRAVLSDHAPVGGPISDELWSAAAAQGWFGLGIDEAAGGVGYGPIEEALLALELGRAVAPGPFIPTILAVHHALALGSAARAAALMDGTLRCAWAEPDPHGGMWLLEPAAADLAIACVDGVVALVPTVGGEIVLPIDERVPSSYLAELPTMTATVVGDQGHALHHRASLLISAYLAGIAEATCAQSVAYVTDREQFGQPVGAFQAVKHRCADMATRAAAAVSQTHVAAIALCDHRDIELHVPSARLVAIDAAVSNAQVNVQNHGGIGFTWEHTAHRYVTRARVVSTMLGGRRAVIDPLVGR